MAKRTIAGVEGVKALVGEELGHSDWLEITQDRVNRFADATEDHQWIHVDPERARVESPFGGTIAHGCLTMSLLPYLIFETIDVTGARMVINYGFNRLRYPAPVRVDSRIRLGIQLASVEEIQGGVQCQLDCTVEIEGETKPALVAEVLFRFYA